MRQVLIRRIARLGDLAASFESQTNAEAVEAGR
jgi:hypothetical protein